MAIRGKIFQNLYIDELPTSNATVEIYSDISTEASNLNNFPINEIHRAVAIMLSNYKNENMHIGIEIKTKGLSRDFRLPIVITKENIFYIIKIVDNYGSIEKAAEKINSLVEAATTSLINAFEIKGIIVSLENKEDLYSSFKKEISNKYNILIINSSKIEEIVKDINDIIKYGCINK